MNGSSDKLGQTAMDKHDEYATAGGHAEDGAIHSRRINEIGNHTNHFLGVLLHPG